MMVSQQVLAEYVGAGESRTSFRRPGLNSMIVPVSSMTMMASSEACSMVRADNLADMRVGGQRSMASPMASEMM